MTRDVLARTALADIPKILTLQDRNPHSPTYGCFDRNFWQYKIIDFPSGMAQEFVYPLALVWSLDLPDNPYRGDAAVREWVVAGLRYAARSSHRDGSCDDYFPYERAAGATAFSLLACLDAADILGFADPQFDDFLRRRGAWLADHRESGRLSNHEALIALCLARLGQRTGDDDWFERSGRRLDRVLGWQHEEGWFQEYEGCDPGYLTLTISALARLHEISPRDDLAAALERAVRFVAEFVHPDGSFGGEYGSRNTYNFFPHGFELVGRSMPEALAINDRVLAGTAAGRAPCHADDHIVGHHAWNRLLAWRDYVADRPPPPVPGDGRRVFPGAGLLVDRRGAEVLFLAFGKGGVFKAFRDDRLIASDTQISLRMRDGRTAVAHMIGGAQPVLAEDEIRISGRFAWAKQAAMTPAKLLILRLLMLTVGRFASDLVRRILQRLLITGRSDTPFGFERILTWREGRWHIRDTVLADSWQDVAEAGLGGHQTSIHVVMSRTYQSGQMTPWLDLTERVRALENGAPLVVERTL